MDIYIDEAGIKSTSDSLTEEARSLLTQINMLNRTIDDINQAWQGTDALKYINVMREKYIVALHELKDFIDEYTIYLNNIPGAYSTLDEAFSNKNLSV